MKCTNALRDLLSNDAFDVSYGVGEEKDSPSGVVDTKPLAWAQLAEITKCLKVHNRLPAEITDEDIAALSGHTAWRWFENLRDPRLSFLAMNKFAICALAVAAGMALSGCQTTGVDSASSSFAPKTVAKPKASKSKPNIKPVMLTTFMM